MSRVGKVPITIPSGIEVKIEGARVTVKGPRGELSRDLIPDMKLNLSDGVLTVARPGDHPRHRAAHGLTRTLIYNMVIGVSEGVAKTLGPPRLPGYRRLAHSSAQVIDDSSGHTLVAASDVEAGLRGQRNGKKKTQVAELVGEALARKAAEKGIKAVVFDRGGFRG